MLQKSTIECDTERTILFLDLGPLNFGISLDRPAIIYDSRCAVMMMSSVKVSITIKPDFKTFDGSLQSEYASDNSSPEIPCTGCSKE